MTIQKIASSGTKEGILKLIEDYFYSSHYSVNFETGELKNRNGILANMAVKFEKKRYIFYYTS